ncbi:MAG: hypothetical protein ACRYG7_46115 [Janthinobacterium lividum]
MATQSPPPKKSAGGRISKKTPGVAYDATAYYIPETLAGLLQYVEMVSRKKADPILSQPILEEGVARQIMLICKQKNIIIPEDLLPTENPDWCTKFRNLNTAISTTLATAAAAGSGA